MHRLPIIGSSWLFALLLLAGCGGGGGGGGTGAGSASAAVPATGTGKVLPTVQVDYEPAGARWDLRAQDYFPSHDGDVWHYRVTVLGQPASGQRTRRIVALDAARFLLVEGSGSATSSDTVYTRSSNGHVLGPDEILGSSAPALAKGIVGSFAEYIEPFYAVGGQRRLVRQGDWGWDLDGDGIDESFAFEYSQVLQGYGQLQTPSGTVNALMFTTVMTFSLVPSSPAKTTGTVVATETTWWAPGVGLLQAARQLKMPDGTSSYEELHLSGGTVHGADLSGMAVLAAP